MESCGNHSCKNTFDKTSDEHVLCPVCKGIAYCSVKCQTVDWAIHQCPNVYLTDSLTTVNGFFHEIVPGEEGFEVVGDTKIVAQKNEDGSVTQKLIEAPSIGWEERNNTMISTKGAKPSEFLKDRSYRMIIQASGEKEHVLTGTFRENTVYASSESKRMREAAKTQLWVTDQTKYVFSPDVQSIIDADIMMYLTGSLSVAVAPAKGDKMYAWMASGYRLGFKSRSKLRTLFSNFKRMLSVNLKKRYSKVPYLVDKVGDFLYLYSRDVAGNACFATFIMSAGTTKVQLVDIEFHVPQQTVDSLERNEVPEEPEEEMPLPQAAGAPFIFNIRDVNHVTGLLMASELSKLHEPDKVTQEHLASEAVLRKYLSTFSEGPVKSDMEPISSEVSMAAEHLQIGVLLYTKNYYMKKMQKEDTEGRLAVKLAQDIANDLAKARAAGSKGLKGKIASVKKNRLMKRLNDLNDVLDTIIKKKSFTPTATTAANYKRAQDILNAARSSAVIDEDIAEDT